MKTKTRFHKLTAWLLTLAMLMTFIPSMTLPAFAADADCVAWNDPNVNGVIDDDESTFASLSEAFTAVLNGTATYIRLNSDASFSDWIEISDKEFTVDMNGHKLYNNFGSFDLSGSAKMTVTDTGEKLGEYTSGDFLAYVSGNATLIIEKGNYKNFLVDCWDDSNIIINGGTIDAQVCIGSNLEVNGDAKFVRSIEFSDGFCDFSDYENIKDIKLYVSSQNVSNFAVATYFALPDGYCFYDSSNTAVTSLEKSKTYTIGEVQTGGDGGGTTTTEAKWGADADNLNNSGKIEEAIAAATAENSSVGYIQLQSKVTRESSINVESGEFTIDLNGCEWDGASGVLDISGNANVIIKDSGEGGILKTTNEHDPVIILNGSATLEIAGGTIDGYLAPRSRYVRQRQRNRSRTYRIGRNDSN